MRTPRAKHEPYTSQQLQKPQDLLDLRLVGATANSFSRPLIWMPWAHNMAYSWSSTEVLPQDLTIHTLFQASMQVATARVFSTATDTVPGDPAW